MISTYGAYLHKQIRRTWTNETPFPTSFSTFFFSAKEVGWDLTSISTHFPSVFLSNYTRNYLSRTSIHDVYYNIA